MIVGYWLTVLVELPVLVVGLGKAHPLGRRLASAFWLTACTYPVVILVLPPLLVEPSWGSRGLYIAVAETFAPIAECGLFWLAFKKLSRRDAVVIVGANLCSFAFGLLLGAIGWF